jgi:hypothetical protein
MGAGNRNSIHSVLVLGCLVLGLVWVAARLTHNIDRPPTPAPVHHSVNNKTGHNKQTGHAKK